LGKEIATNKLQRKTDSRHQILLSNLHRPAKITDKY